MCSKKITAFDPLAAPDPCVVCGQASVTHQSLYPSEEPLFAACKIRYCSHCGLGFVAGARALLEGYYEQQYSRTNRGDRQIDPKVYFSDEKREKSPRLRRYFNRAKRQLSILEELGNPVKSLLDFGSGPGYLLHVSQATERAALEPDEDSQKYLSHIGARRFKAVEDLPRGKFNAVVASHAVEHLTIEDLIPNLRRLIESLKPGGHLLIEVPQGGLSYLYLNGQHDPHTIFFTPESLTRAVEAAGGEVVFSRCFAPKASPLRPDAIYVPSGDAFCQSRRGAMTIVGRRPRRFGRLRDWLARSGPARSQTDAGTTAMVTDPPGAARPLPTGAA
ncbi:MAG: class I SAM-dependent methyltransferase [Rhodobacteraceae bacterium]|nr:MAG: class I SAM-dependent methyltransferase [Paracoccaceae bacterium]